MPPYRYDTNNLGKWGSKRLNHEAYILHRATNNSETLGNLGKISRRASAVTFPNNDGTVLVNAICSAREVSPSNAKTAAAVARVPQSEVEIQEYLGQIKSLNGNDVIAEIGPPDDLDRWEVIIPGAIFTEQPEVYQEIACKITRWGSHAEMTVQILSNEPLPELKDFGIDKEELLSWASQLDV